MEAKFTLAQAAEAVGGRYVGPEEVLNKEIFSVTTDSRKAGEGSIFAAIKGERTDGHKYAAATAEQGCVCCICERPIDGAIPYILVESTVAALQRLAAWYRQSTGVKVIGITGSVGKTTCKEVVSSVLGVKYRVHKTSGNFNNEIGLPLTLLDMPRETEVAVIEMGMSDFGEMRLLSSIARPDMCVMTNIGHSHIGILGSQEGIFKAKSEIFEYMLPDAPAFLNGDDPFLKTVERPNRRFFGFGTDNDIAVSHVEDLGLKGTRCVISAFGQRLDSRVSIPGVHVLYAVAAGVGIGFEMGLTKDEVLRGIASADTISGRVNLIERDGLTIIDDCYNAAPSSMKAGLDLLSTAKGDTLAILGDMGELGGEAERLHREVGEYAAGKSIGLVAAVGQLSRALYEGCDAAGGRCEYFENKEALKRELPRILPKNGAVLVKASHFMEFHEIVTLCQK